MLKLDINTDYEIYNPKDIDVEKLPVIYGFNNGGPSGFLSGVLLAEDGKCLGGHACSNESWMLNDLGILIGSRPDRHNDSFKPHYPDGYRMDFISIKDVKGHEFLDKAYALNQLKRMEDSKDA